MEPKAHAPLLVESFPKSPRTRSEASQFSGSHNYKTKQNKLPSFIDRCQGHIVTHPLFMFAMLAAKGILFFPFAIVPNTCTHIEQVPFCINLFG